MVSYAWCLLVRFIPWRLESINDIFLKKAMQKFSFVYFKHCKRHCKSFKISPSIKILKFKKVRLCILSPVVKTQFTRTNYQAIPFATPTYTIYTEEFSSLAQTVLNGSLCLGQFQYLLGHSQTLCKTHLSQQVLRVFNKNQPFAQVYQIRKSA